MSRKTVYRATCLGRPIGPWRTKIEQVRRDHAGRVSLYVNDFNEPARRAYAAAGFRQAGELTTLLF